jgi:hypothetical protein
LNQLPWHAPITKALRAAAYFVAHAAVALVIIGAISLVRAACQWLGDPKLFDLIPLVYLFDAMELAALAVFIPCGVIEAYRVFRE